LIRLLLLEDDPLLAKSLIKVLKKNSFEVVWAQNGIEGSSIVYDEKFDLYLFDINLPQYNGDDLLADLRKAEDFTPCILISALVDIASITKGFSSGADDYIKKPFDIDELLVRIYAKTNKLKKTILYKNFEYFIDENKLLRDNQEVILAYKLKMILVLLLKNYPNPVSQEYFTEHLDDISNLSLRVHITKLKQKTGIDIQNIRAIGYKLA
jgi:DNA-binding response OmpR family regulator